MITCNGKVYRNLQEQVLKNQMDIEELNIKTDDIVNTDIGELRTEFEEHVEAADAKILANEGAIAALDGKALKTPIQAPYTDVLVGIDSNNDQQIIYLGSNLSISGNTLNATGGGGGGGGELTFMAELTFDGQDFSLPGKDCIISIRSSNFRATAVIAGQSEESYPYVFSTEFIYLDSVADPQKGYIESQDGTCYLRLPYYDYSQPITIYAKAL